MSKGSRDQRDQPKTHGNSVTADKPTAKQIDRAWAIARACEPGLRTDGPDHAAVAHWLGRDDAPAIETAEQASQAIEDGLALRVGRHRVSLTRLEQQGLNAIERRKRLLRDRDIAWGEARIQAVDGLRLEPEDMDDASIVADFAAFARLRSARCDLQNERLTGRLLDNALRWKMEKLENVDRPARYVICDCGMIFEKSRPNVKRCQDCRARDTRPSAPEFVVDAQAVRLPSGDIGRRYVAICSECNSDFVVVGPNTRGRYRGLCDDCEPPKVRQRRSRAARKASDR